MPIKTTDLEGLVPRVTRDVPLLDRPPMGYLEAVIAKTIHDLGPDEASGLNVARQLSIDSGVWLDGAEIYLALGRLNDPKGFVRHMRTIRQLRGPPTKTYELTPAGHAALKATMAHHEAVLAKLKSQPKRAKPQKHEPTGANGGSDEERVAAAKRHESKRSRRSRVR
jgi:DNA-binding PadR family transcriptional regulator